MGDRPEQRDAPRDARRDEPRNGRRDEPRDARRDAQLDARRDEPRDGPRAGQLARPPAAEERLRRDVARKAGRRRLALRERNRSIWFSLGFFGLVGWSIAIPTLLGIGLGVWLDSRWPGRVSWTLTLLVVGIVVGCLNAWYWIKHEMGNH